MERKLVVSLLRKSIEELGMITDGFMEMEAYPASIILLARRKTEDLLDYIRQLEDIRQQPAAVEASPVEERVAEEDAPVDVSADEKRQEKDPLPVEEETRPVEEEVPLMEEEVQSVEEVVQPVEEEVPPLEDVLQPGTEPVTETSPASLPEGEAPPVGQPIPAGNVRQDTPAATEETVRMAMPERVENTIADAHSQRKIDDIRQAISIGDRFRFQRELFAGNGELMNKTLSKLNGMATLEEAGDYLQSKFNWTPDDETVESFYQIVKRRF